MLRYPTYMAVGTRTIALVTEDGQSFEDLGIEERKEGQVIIKCEAAQLVKDGSPCEWNKMGSDGYTFCSSSTEINRLRDENAKLRELVRDTCNLLPHADWPSTECDDMASACIDQAIELGVTCE